jgi:asparagine synthase (glutamine-hydrolysing)
MSGRVDADLRRALYTGPLEALDGDAATRAVATIAGGVVDDPLPATLYIDAQLALPDDMLHYFDRMSMAHSLEVRVPFLDHHVVEYCATIPANLKVRRLNRKWVLKHAARGILPDRIIDKRKLGFFRGSTDAWLRSQVRGAASHYLLDANPHYGDFLDRDVVRGLVTAQAGGESGDIHLLLSILMLEVWLRSYVPRAIGEDRADELALAR